MLKLYNCRSNNKKMTDDRNKIIKMYNDVGFCPSFSFKWIALAIHYRPLWFSPLTLRLNSKQPNIINTSP